MNVLFIGNSYTFNLPEAIAGLATAHNKTFTYKAISKGGQTLKQHAKSPETLATIQTGYWDYVVLQEQSQIPSFAEEQRAIHMYPYAIKLSAAIQEAQAKTLFYLTWGHQQGDRLNIANDSFTSMQQRLQQGYENAARQCSARIVPVGAAWAAAQAQDNYIDLYCRDGSHPNENGVYLSACVFFRFLFNTDLQVDLGLLAHSSTKTTVPAAKIKFLMGVANSLNLAM